MKTKFLLTIGTAAAIAVAGFTSTFNASAAGPTNTRPQHVKKIPGPGSLLNRVIQYLGLTPAQVTSIKNILRDHKGEISPLLEELHETRVTLRETIRKPGVTEVDVRAASASVAEVEADLPVERAKIYAEIAEVLTPAQEEKIKDMANKFDEFIQKALTHFEEQLARD